MLSKPDQESQVALECCKNVLSIYCQCQIIFRMHKERQTTDVINYWYHITSLHSWIYFWIHLTLSNFAMSQFQGTFLHFTKLKLSLAMNCCNVWVCLMHSMLDDYLQLKYTVTLSFSTSHPSTDAVVVKHLVCCQIISCCHTYCSLSNISLLSDICIITCNYKTIHFQYYQS